MTKFVLFSDLDGTLLDSKYSFRKALPGLERIKETGSSLVLCTSKTKAETMEYEEKLGLREPFIVENGGAVYIPAGYFHHEIPKAEAEGSYLVLRLGTGASEIEKEVDQLAKQVEIAPFHSMNVKDIMEETGLNAEQALKAGEKQFIASFKLMNKMDAKKAERFFREKGFTMSKGGRFYAVMKGNDKGSAVKILVEHYWKDFAGVVSVGLGNEENDFGMLKACDKPFLIAKRGGKYASNDFPKAGGIGPSGWNKAVLKVLENEKKA